MGLFDFLKPKREETGRGFIDDEKAAKDFEENSSEEISWDEFLEKEKTREEFLDAVEEVPKSESLDKQAEFIKTTDKEASSVKPYTGDIDRIYNISSKSEKTIEFDNEPIEEKEKEDEKQAEIKAETQKGFLAKLKEGLGKTRNSILGSVDSVLNAFTKIDEDLFEELEETLIMADMGVQTTMDIIENLRKRVKKEGATEPPLIKDMLIDEITAILTSDEKEDYEIEMPAVLLVIGVNGVGKTTTIGKLANNLKSEGKSVILAAADTFRAAAIDQLEVWGERSGIDVIKHEENSDPAAVVYDALNAAKSRKTDVLICDTAGRLHNKKNLMEELRKIAKVIEREYPKAHKEVFLVLDATTGQNALQQAKLFKEVADITGIILTKLDGTAKGGIVVAIKNELQIPVRFIGVGEGIKDLQRFDAKSFAEALFGE